MGGKDALRSFLYQGFASVLEALTGESDWDKTYRILNIKTSNDKVDIELEDGQIQNVGVISPSGTSLCNATWSCSILACEPAKVELLFSYK